MPGRFRTWLKPLRFRTALISTVTNAVLICGFAGSREIF